MFRNRITRAIVIAIADRTVGQVTMLPGEPSR